MGKEIYISMEEDLSKYNPEGSTLRKAQLRMLDILIEVDKICRKNNIPYFLESGTLLGAVRHSGFIPWDDDIDISVMLSDYPRLRKVLQEQLPSTMVFQDTTTDSNYPMLIAKIRDTKSYFEEDYTQKLTHKGLYIDIFPLEKIPCWKWKQFLDYLYGHSVRALHNYTDRKDKIRSAFLYPFAKILVLLTRLINKLIQTDLISYQYGRKTYVQYRLTDIFPLKEMSFEGHSFWAHNNPDALLRICYGDYMQIPPKEKRQVHTNKIEFYD